MKQVFQRTIVDENGDVVPNAELEIRYESNGQLALTWTDRAGETTGSNPVQADDDGFVQIYLDPGRYKMTPLSSGQGVGDPWRDVLILSENLVSFDALYSAESTTLFREPPVTTGTSSAYTVDGWSGLTFVEDRVYTARIHTDNAAGASIEGLDILNLDGSAIEAGQLKENGVYKFLYVDDSPATVRLLDVSSHQKLTRFYESNINILTNTISSTNTNGNIVLAPNGNGVVQTSKLDANGGTIDGTTIGASTPAAATVSSLLITGVQANRYMVATGAGANAKRWREVIDTSGNLIIQTRTDADGGGENLLIVSRSGTTIGTVNFASGTLQSGGNSVSVNSTSATHTCQQIELGHASDTTLTRSSAGVMAVEGVTVPLNSTTSTHTCQQIELGHASDTTITRPAAGRAQIEGREIVTATASATQLTATIDQIENVCASATLNDLADNLTSTASEIDAAVAASAPPSVSGYVAATATYLHEDGGNSTSFNVTTNISDGSFESVGPTGSGATNIWTALDDLPASAKMATIGIVISTDNAVDDEGVIWVFARQTGSSATGNRTMVSRFAFVYDDNAGQFQGIGSVADIPLDGSLRFDIGWSTAGTAGTLDGTVLIYLKGFKV